MIDHVTIQVALADSVPRLNERLTAGVSLFFR